jgi:hypothetical protein
VYDFCAAVRVCKRWYLLSRDFRVYEKNKTLQLYYVSRIISGRFFWTHMKELVRQSILVKNLPCIIPDGRPEKIYTFTEIICKDDRPKLITDLLSFTPAEFDPAHYNHRSPFWRLLKRGLYDVFKVAMASAKRIHGADFDCFNIRGDSLVVRCTKLGDGFIPALKFLLEQGAE